MLFSELIEAELKPEIRPLVDKLLQVKSTTSELGTGKRLDALNDYIEETISELSEAINGMPRENKASWDRINELFLKTVLL